MLSLNTCNNVNKLIVLPSQKIKYNRFYLYRFAMINYKAIDILRTFTKEDLKRFKDFLRSPFFNKSGKLAKFYDSLIVFYPEFNSKFLKEEKLLKRVNPDLPFNKSTMLNLFSDLAKAAEKYFIQLGIQKNETESLDFLRDELFKRKFL